MSHEFISPNWHVMFIHYPIAFLSAGIVIELLSFLWPRGLFRAAGRWIMLLGALMAIPTLTVGLYAFRTVVGGHGYAWHELRQSSGWTSDQWLTRHIWLNSLGVAAVVSGVTTWVAASDAWRRRLYFPVLLLLIAGMGLFGAGAWYGGESVYRFGTAVQLSSSQSTGIGQRHEGIKWYVPPLELHVLLAGITVAVGIGALGLTIRRLERPAPVSEPREIIGPGDEDMPQTHDPRIPEEPRTPGAPHTGRPVFAGRFWLLAAIAGLGAALAGLWSVIEVLTGESLKKNLHMVVQSDHRRLLLHVIFGVTLVVLTLVLAGLGRFGRQRRRMNGAFLILFVLVTALQLWLGIALLYDGHSGPLLGFNPPGATP